MASVCVKVTGMMKVAESRSARFPGRAIRPGGSQSAGISTHQLRRGKQYSVLQEPPGFPLSGRRDRLMNVSPLTVSPTARDLRPAEV